MIEYKISKLGNIIKIENGNISLLILDDNNKDYQKYVDYLKKGGSVESVDFISNEESIQIKEQKIEQLKKQQYEELKDTDWYYVRNIETGLEIPENIKQLRSSIRDKYDSLINKLNYENNLPCMQTSR